MKVVYYVIQRRLVDNVIQRAIIKYVQVVSNVKGLMKIVKYVMNKIGVLYAKTTNIYQHRIRLERNNYVHQTVNQFIVVNVVRIVAYLV